MKRLFFLLFVFSFISRTYAQQNSISDISDCYIVHLKCKHIQHNKTQIKDDTEYVIRIESKQGPAGWLKVWVDNILTKKSILPFQSSRKNCWTKKRIIEDIPQQNVVYVFGGGTNGEYKFHYQSYNTENNNSSINVIGINDKNNNEIIDIYHVSSCDFYHEVQGSRTLENGIRISTMEKKKKISNYWPVFETHNNLLTTFFANIYDYYR